LHQKRFANCRCLGKETDNVCLAIRDDIGSEELHRRTPRERDSRVSARLIAIANALEGMDLE
jgi:hypothetical protein